jgi:hypothetical protein
MRSDVVGIHSQPLNVHFDRVVEVALTQDGVGSIEVWPTPAVVLVIRGRN